MNKKILAIILIIWGSIVSLFGTLLLVLLVPLVLESKETEELVANLILGVIILGTTLGLGGFPLYKGIQILRKRGAKKVIKRAPQNLVNYENCEVESTDHRILCRDKQYDNGDWPLIMMLVKCFCVTILPVVLAVWGYQFIGESANYRIQPGTWQAYASLLVVVAVSVVIVAGLWLCGKYNALGNKFYYYIIDENDGLSMTHMGQGRLGYYVEKKAPLLEKVKATPSILYVLIYSLSIHSRRIAFNLARMQMYFKVNQKHHFVEKLLLGNDYERYCQKVVGVRKIKYFARGCEVWLVCMQDGVEQHVKQIIYRETTNYNLLMSKIKELEPGARKGYELSDNQVRQVRKNIGRRIAIQFAIIGAFVWVITGSIRLYLVASYKVSVWEPGVFRLLEQRIANRSRRRVLQAIYACAMSVFLVLGKMVLDIIRPNVFTFVPVEVQKYYEPKRSFWQKIGGDYKYFATVKYNNSTVDVGMSKEMWEKKEVSRPLLVLRKNVPYCLIYQEIS